MNKYKLPKIYAVWGTKIGDEEWQEELLTSITDFARVEACKVWAKDNGFTNIRVSIFNRKKSLTFPTIV
jgi:hypothetical protein